MKSRKIIPTYVFDEEGNLVYSCQNVIDGFKRFIKRWNKGYIRISITLKRRENIRSYITQCRLAFYTNLVGINRALVGAGLNSISEQDVDSLFADALTNSEVKNSVYTFGFSIKDGTVRADRVN